MRECTRAGAVCFRKKRELFKIHQIINDKEMRPPMTIQNETNIFAEHAMVTEYLRALLSEANRLIEVKNVALSEAQKMAGYIAEIRWLLDEWSLQESKFVPARPMAEEVRILKVRFLELEGLVKEVRNSLDLERRTVR